MIKTLKLLSPLFSLFAISAAAQVVTVTSGGNMIINGDGHLVVNNGGIVNNGTLSAGNGTVSLTGNTASTIVSSGSPLQFYNLVMNQAGGVKLLGPIAVSNQLVLTQGVLDMNGFDINLGTTGNLVGEHANSYITSSSTGFVLRTATLNAPAAANPGNLGLEITSKVNMGTTLIKRGHQQQVSASGYSIRRFYDVLPTNNQSLNATVNFHYLDAELAGINENELKAWSALGNSRNWNLLGGNQTAGNSVIQGGLHTLSRITLGSTISHSLVTLPNELRVLAFPNPTRSALTIRFASPAATSVQLWLTSGNGLTVFSKTIAAEIGLNEVKCEIGSLAAGTYMMHFSGIAHPAIKIIKD